MGRRQAAGVTRVMMIDPHALCFYHSVQVALNKGVFPIDDWVKMAPVATNPQILYMKASVVRATGKVTITYHSDSSCGDTTIRLVRNEKARVAEYRKGGAFVFLIRLVGGVATRSPPCVWPTRVRRGRQY